MGGGVGAEAAADLVAERREVAVDGFDPFEVLVRSVALWSRWISPRRPVTSRRNSSWRRSISSWFAWMIPIIQPRIAACDSAGRSSRGRGGTPGGRARAGRVAGDQLGRRRPRPDLGRRPAADDRPGAGGLDPDVEAGRADHQGVAVPQPGRAGTGRSLIQSPRPTRSTRNAAVGGPDQDAMDPGGRGPLDPDAAIRRAAEEDQLRAEDQRGPRSADSGRASPGPATTGRRRRAGRPPRRRRRRGRRGPRSARSDGRRPPARRPAPASPRPRRRRRPGCRSGRRGRRRTGLGGRGGDRRGGC